MDCARIFCCRRRKKQLALVAMFNFYCILLFFIHFQGSGINSKQPVQSPQTQRNVQKNASTIQLAANEGTLKKQNKQAELPDLHHTLQNILQKYPSEAKLPVVYNVSLSNEIKLNRTVPDTRPDLCKSVNNDVTLPNVSVVIAFYNEALSVLLRTVYSVINRTPPYLLSEVILIDDCSTLLPVKNGLLNLTSSIPQVKVIRSNNREGLAKSRMQGARKATGQVLVFLDAHMECNINWLEPLLIELQYNKNIVLQPTIDVIWKDLTYNKAMSLVRGGFDWDLRYTWFEVPEYLKIMMSTNTSPYTTPVLTGSATAIWRDYFFSLGGFDEELQTYGGEHFDISFKVWMCGGKILTVPCSRVGHIFITANDVIQSDYTRRNLRRVAMIWFEEYEYIFNNIVSTQAPLLPVTEKELLSIKAIKHQLLRDGCKHFKWYLESVFTEIKVPPTDSVLYGEIKRKDGCFKVLPDKFIGVTYDCFRNVRFTENDFAFNEKKQLMYGNECVGVDSVYRYLKVSACDKTQGFAAGEFNFESRTNSSFGTIEFYETDTNFKQCATHVTATSDIHKAEQMVQVLPCQVKSEYQKWKFTYRFRH